jgi:glycosyltransferase involved in cell wall biosynthesis
MIKKIKVAWLSAYPIRELEDKLSLARSVGGFHPCSWVVNLAAALAAREDVELHLITQTHLIQKDQILISNGIVFHVLKRGVPFTNRGFPAFLPLDVMTGFIAERRRIGRELKCIQPDIVHGHGTENYQALAAIDSELPCIISIQGIISEYVKTNPSFRFKVVRHYERQAVRKAYNFTCRTEFDTGFVRSVNPTARIFQIHEAMSPVYFQNRWELRSENTLLFVGSLENRKGLPTLLEAMHLIVQKKPDTLLTIIGDGPIPQYQQRCENLGIAKQVHFVGFQQPDAIARYHRESQVFVLPSENENSPNAVAEAMVSGIPVVTTNVGGIPSMVENEKTGLLVPPNSPDQLAAAVLRLLDDFPLRQQLGSNAQTVARSRHEPKHIADATMQAYREILRTSQD